MPEQLSLDLPVRKTPGRSDFFVTESNAMALAMVDAWRDWPLGKLALAGPRGSGKSHLCAIWAAESGARIVPAGALSGMSEPEVFALADGALCLEDVHLVAGQSGPETALFHLHNLLAAAHRPLLVTGIGAPSRWGIALPDLRSRLEAAQVAHLREPDDQLLSVVLAKLFAERATVPAAGVIPYLVTHMPRSFEVAAMLVDRIDRLAMGTRKGVTLVRAREALSSLEHQGFDL